MNNTLTKSIRLASLSPTVRRLSSTAPQNNDSQYRFQTLAVSTPHEFVKHVELNRPEKRNAMNATFFSELEKCFQYLGEDKDCRAVLVSGRGKGFTSGLDLAEFSETLNVGQDEDDVGRKAFSFRSIIKRFQDSISSLEKCHKPVIALVNGHCIGGGVDLITACDIRYCTREAWFSVREVDVGLAADIGTLQRLPKVVGNGSLAREIIYTARNFTSEEAKSLGLVSQVFADEKTMIEKGLELATLIASKSPIAVQGSKINLVYSRDRTVDEGLHFMSVWNASMLQSEDLLKAAMAAMTKDKAKFSKL